MTSMLRNIEFWIQTFDENKYVWTTDYYTFHKILGIIICHYIMMNSIKLGQIVKESNFLFNF